MSIVAQITGQRLLGHATFPCMISNNQDRVACAWDSKQFHAEVGSKVYYLGAILLRNLQPLYCCILINRRAEQSKRLVSCAVLFLA